MTVVAKLRAAFRGGGHSSPGIVTVLRTHRFMAGCAQECVYLLEVRPLPKSVKVKM